MFLTRLAAAALVTAGLTGATVATGGTASARPADDGIASMWSPYIPDVWHVPSDVLLTIGPDGPRFVGPQGSLFNGAPDVVERRVDAWWERRLAAGLTPEEADLALARLNR